MAFRYGDPGGRVYNIVGTSQVNLIAWWGSSGGNLTAWSTVSGGGRTGGNCLRLATPVPGNASSYLAKTFDSQQIWGIAFALKISSLASAIFPLCGISDAGTIQCDLRLLTDGTLRVTRNGTTVGTTTAAIGINTWNHIEWKTKIDGSVGTTDVRINGVSALSMINQNTKATGNSSANQVSIANTVGGNLVGNFDYDDIIIYDGQVNDPQGNPDITGLIGDCGLVWLQPNADGTTSQFARDSGANNYARVSDVTPDGDTSYVEDGTIGHIDTYNIANLPGNVGSVKSLGVVSYARKTDFSARGMKHELRSNSTNVAHTNEILLPDSYGYFMSVWGQNPTGTPAAWTVTDVNNLEIGRQVSS